MYMQSWSHDFDVHRDITHTYMRHAHITHVTYIYIYFGVLL